METILSMLKLALDYLGEESEIEASKVSQVEIEKGFSAWDVDMWTPAGRCVAFIGEHLNGQWEVYHLHWYDTCAVCGEVASQQCDGCKGFFCDAHYEEHLHDNARYLAKGTSNV